MTRLLLRLTLYFDLGCFFIFGLLTLTEDTGLVEALAGVTEGFALLEGGAIFGLALGDGMADGPDDTYSEGEGWGMKSTPTPFKKSGMTKSVMRCSSRFWCPPS